MNITIPNTLSNTDPEMDAIINAEAERQQYTIELIASENIVSTSLMEAQGSLLTNKYAEGYPGRRYYGGCEEVDKAEELAKSRAKELFKTDYLVNVQAHSGSQANMAAYHAMDLKHGDKVLGMSLDHGGHLTHGYKLNFSGRDYEMGFYGVEEETGAIDYDKLEAQAIEFQPKMIIAGASNYSRTLDFEKFAEIAKKVDAKLMVDMAHIAGLVATGLHPTPFGYADVITTTTHKTLRGPRGGMIFSKTLDIQKKVNSRIFPGIQGGPLMHVIAAKAVAFGEALKPEFTEYMQTVKDSMTAMAEVFKEEGFDIISKGTDNHLLTLNVMSQNVTGKEAEDLLHEVNITVNKNLIPYDKQPAQTASGIRIGAAAVCSRGFGVKEVRQTAKMMSKVLKNKDDKQIIEEVKAEAIALCKNFPIYK